jgi:hypothetical protein
MTSFLAWFMPSLFFLTGCAAHTLHREADRVHFRLKDGKAREVLFSCSLESFGLQRAKKKDGATWEVAVPDGGEFTYFYVIDGKVHLPDCRYREKDDFGAYNCLYKPDM